MPVSYESALKWFTRLPVESTEYIFALIREEKDIVRQEERERARRIIEELDYELKIRFGVVHSTQSEQYFKKALKKLNSSE